jgi:tetratricopeptide (TPR) repeat protein
VAIQSLICISIGSDCIQVAHGVIARAKGAQFFNRWTDQPEKTLEEAIVRAKTSISLDNNDPGAYAALGYIYRYTGDETSSIVNLERATILNPSDANIKLEYAHTLDWFRYQKQALPEINEAIKLSPRDPRLENMLFYKAHIQFHLLEFEDSLSTTKEMSGVLTTDTWRVFYHLMRAANQARLGRNDSAKKSIQAALKVNPKLTLSAMRK